MIKFLELFVWNDDAPANQESESTDGAVDSNQVGTSDGLSESSSSSLSSSSQKKVHPYDNLSPHEKKLREQEDAFYFAGLHLNGGDERGATNQFSNPIEGKLDDYEENIENMSSLDKMAFLINSKVDRLLRVEN